MIVFSNSDRIPRDPKSVVTVGTFDGVHQGHRKILEAVVHKARQLDGRSVAVTFEPHPRIVVSKEKTLPLLSTIEEKTALFDEIGIDVLVIIDFTFAFSQQQPEAFIKHFLVDTIGLSEIVVGYDHRFGKARDGNDALLKGLGSEFGFSVTKINAVALQGQTVSSTKVRESVLNGDVEKARLMLNRPYAFSGKVIKGDGRGKGLGFPTANVDLLNRHKAVPSAGVYTVKAGCKNSCFEGVMNIGSRPTFHTEEKEVIEVHLIERNINLYDEIINIEVYTRIREEMKFSAKDELTSQIQKDICEAKSFFKDLSK